MPTVMIYWSDGRSDDQKQKVVQRITDALVEDGDANLDDVLIIFQTIEKGDAARGGKVIGAEPDATTPSHHHVKGNSSHA